MKKQIELLNDLLKKRAEEMKTKTKEESESFLKRAGILGEDGLISDNYPNLKKFIEKQ